MANNIDAASIFSAVRNSLSSAFNILQQANYQYILKNQNRYLYGEIGLSPKYMYQVKEAGAITSFLTFAGDVTASILLDYTTNHAAKQLALNLGTNFEKTFQDVFTEHMHRTVDYQYLFPLKIGIFGNKVLQKNVLTLDILDMTTELDAVQIGELYIPPSSFSFNHMDECQDFFLKGNHLLEKTNSKNYYTLNLSGKSGAFYIPFLGLERMFRKYSINYNWFFNFTMAVLNGGYNVNTLADLLNKIGNLSDLIASLSATIAQKAQDQLDLNNAISTSGVRTQEQDFQLAQLNSEVAVLATLQAQMTKFSKELANLASTGSSLYTTPTIDTIDKQYIEFQDYRYIGTIKDFNISEAGPNLFEYTLSMEVERVQRVPFSLTLIRSITKLAADGIQSILSGYDFSNIGNDVANFILGAALEPPKNLITHHNMSIHFGEFDKDDNDSYRKIYGHNPYAARLNNPNAFGSVRVTNLNTLVNAIKEGL